MLRLCFGRRYSRCCLGETLWDWCFFAWRCQWKKAWPPLPSWSQQNNLNKSHPDSFLMRLIRFLLSDCSVKEWLWDKFVDEYLEKLWSQPHACSDETLPLHALALRVVKWKSSLQFSRIRSGFASIPLPEEYPGPTSLYYQLLFYFPTMFFIAFML